MWRFVTGGVEILLTAAPGGPQDGPWLPEPHWEEVREENCGREHCSPSLPKTLTEGLKPHPEL